MTETTKKPRAAGKPAGRGRPVLPAAERLRRKLEVRLTDDELTLLRHLAERDGVTVSEWVRRALRLPTGHTPTSS